jgi:hypothetical protein
MNVTGAFGFKDSGILQKDIRKILRIGVYACKHKDVNASEKEDKPMILLGILTVYYLIIHYISKTETRKTAALIHSLDTNE